MALISRGIISTCVILKLFIYGAMATVCDGSGNGEQSIMGGLITRWNENYTLEMYDSMQEGCNLNARCDCGRVG